MTRSRGLFGAAIVLYFIIALEVLIMISPFAAFFYAAFNPVSFSGLPNGRPRAG